MNFYQEVNIYNTSLIPRARSSDSWYLEILLDQSLSKANINFLHAHIAHTEIKSVAKVPTTVRLSAFQAAEKVLALHINGPSIKWSSTHSGAGGGSAGESTESLGGPTLVLHYFLITVKQDLQPRASKWDDSVPQGFSLRLSVSPALMHLFTLQPLHSFEREGPAVLHKYYKEQTTEPVIYPTLICSPAFTLPDSSFLPTPSPLQWEREESDTSGQSWNKVGKFWKRKRKEKEKVTKFKRQVFHLERAECMK